MSAGLEDPPAWEPPPTSECTSETYRCPLPLGAASLQDQYIAQVYRTKLTSEVVKFAIIQQALVGGEWCTVVEIDTDHGHVHLHRWARRVGIRVGSPESLFPIRCTSDVQTGYNMAITLIHDQWQELKRGWDL